MPLKRSPGDVVLLQEVWRGRVWSARPLTVVRDEDDLVALWFPERTTFTRETFVELGAFDDALAGQVREEGFRAVRRAQANEPPFDGPWPEWRPDPAWAMPELPDGWEVPCR